MPLHLNIGAGEKPVPNCIDVDRKSGGEAFPLRIGHREGLEKQLQGLASFERHDNGEAHWELANESVDSIYASHVLEHFGHRQTLDVLKEWVRVLKPGGTIKIAVPNFDFIVNAYNSEHAGQLPIEAYLFGGHTDDDDHHGAMFNDGKLRSLMRLAGLSGIRPWSSTVGDCASLQVSLNLMGTKRMPVDKLDGVHAVLSAPRLGFMDQMTCMVESIHKLKLPTRIRQGCFWGQTLTAAIDQCIADGAEFVLTMDYDTVCQPDDIMDLYRLMRDNPEASAVFATQIGRDRDSLLLTVRENKSKNRSQLAREEIEAELLPASTGHFGLTMLRVSALKSMPKPWFWHQPDKDDGWGEGRIDEDIWFWRQMEKAGMKVFQANHVVVGHLQLVATWPDRDLQPIHQYVGEYRTSGKPEGVLA